MAAWHEQLNNDMRCKNVFLCTPPLALKTKRENKLFHADTSVETEQVKNDFATLLSKALPLDTGEHNQLSYQEFPLKCKPNKSFKIIKNSGPELASAFQNTGINANKM